MSQPARPRNSIYTVRQTVLYGISYPQQQHTQIYIEREREGGRERPICAQQESRGWRKTCCCEGQRRYKSHIDRCDTDVEANEDMSSFRGTDGDRSGGGGVDSRRKGGKEGVGANTKQDDATLQLEMRKEFIQYTETVVAAAEEFIDLFADACNSSMKSKISDAIHHQKIERVLKDVDVSSHLTVESAYATFKRAYGWRTWIHAPEEGVRGLIRETITLYYAPLRMVLDEVHQCTLEASMLAMEECTLLQGVKNENMKRAVEDQVLESLKEWNKATWEQLSRNLHAEVEFPAPERFRALREYIDQLMEKESIKQAERLSIHYRHMLEASLRKLKLSESNLKEMKQDILSSHAVQGIENKEGPEIHAKPEWTEFYMGWLEKKNRYGMWQRRWFAVSSEKQRLWYFAHPEEQPARGAAWLKNCILIDKIPGADPLEFQLIFSSEYSASKDQVISSSQKLLSGSKTKVDMQAITARASSEASKQEWLRMLSRAIRGQMLGQSTINIAAIQDGLGQNKTERKISSKVFPDEEACPHIEEMINKSGENKVRKPRRNKTLRSHGVDIDDMGNQKNDIDEEERLQAEIQLYDEILEQAAKASPTEEEALLLGCVTKAVKEYMIDCQQTITEQASKIIADGMLPMLRSNELHNSILQTLLPEKH